MDYRNNKYNDPWDEGVYGTGNTSPPKSHSGIIALLLILVIFLSGIISVLSFLNIKLFQQLSQQQEVQDPPPMAFSDLHGQMAISATEPTGIPQPYLAQPDVSIQLNRSPQSIDNIPEDGALSWQDIYEKNIPSVVSLLSSADTGTRSGSGVILSSNGYIVTTCQMVDGAETITVDLSDGRSFSAVLVGADSLTDLAVLYVDAPDLQGAEFGDSGALRVGDPVAAIGNPMGTQLGGTLTDGILSAINRDVNYLGRDITLLQSNAALSSGNSGCPLINCYGQIIGIHTSSIFPQEEGDILGLAIPSTTVKQIVDQLISQGYVTGRPTLGLSGSSITPLEQYYFQIPEGLYLDSVDESSDAHIRGIEPGDILLSLEATPITGQKTLDTIVNSHAIGDVLTAVFYRAGEEFTVSLTVTEYTG